MAIHGIIHLIGFAKEWDLGPNGSFSGKTLVPLSENIQKFAGVLWLVTCILLIAATAAYYLKKDWFWMLAGAGLVLSQAMIIIYWTDAKWGTVANVIILTVVVASAAKFNFNKMVRQEVKNMIAASSGKAISITNEKIAKLPRVVQTWLTKSNLAGKEFPVKVHITQKGSMRNDSTSKWMPFDAEQYFTIDNPAFVWSATIHANPLLDIVGRDKYENGKGNMLIKAASLIPIANSSGHEIDQGTLIRYMAEMIWFPHAAVSDYVTWEQLTNQRARVTMNYGGVTATGIYTFNDDGFPSRFDADRYYGFEGTYSKQTWSIKITGYRYFNGLPIGSNSEVTWKLKEGDFTWFRLEVTDVEYN